MKKQKQVEKKLSLKKLQMTKITSRLNSIRGGDNGVGNDTVLDETFTKSKNKNGGIEN
ncbi:hypothetical protein NZ698_09375 [Chryseobacterium sp. PBS4-4]|uniref:Uncharacterized protein n=1 Tax=Chryseobacterium edaphi TaxID=2976532 RepID=A0ABT2W5Z8_9FLAO|nr:hypothetical protein [Chryseobacterium edaphi]MCU7617408.1 hypothetical protein [Chryseobacterium edaphi]